MSIFKLTEDDKIITYPVKLYQLSWPVVILLTIAIFT
jgi:hypothetical protein